VTWIQRCRVWIDTHQITAKWKAGPHGVSNFGVSSHGSVNIFTLESLWMDKRNSEKNLWFGILPTVSNFRMKSESSVNEAASLNLFFYSQFHSTMCFIDLGKLNLLKISLPWSKSGKQTVDGIKNWEGRLIGVNHRAILLETTS
jgi:hypothetical protein